jgi:hypothetical protein
LGVGHIPAVFGFIDQRRVVFEQAAQVFPVGGKVGMDLFRHRVFTVIAQEVLGQEFTQIKLLFIS